MNVPAASNAPILVLRKTLDGQKAQAQALLQCLPPPPSGKGLHVDVYA